MLVRLAILKEIPILQDIEDDASELFGTLPKLAFVLDYPAREIAEYIEIVRSGRAFVAEGDSDITGFILMGVVDGQAHILELSVRMKYQRQGIGRRLIDTGADWARAQGFGEITLTTFRDAPWNAPAYVRLGFEFVQPSDERPELSCITEHERSIGLNRAERVAMRRSV